MMGATARSGEGLAETRSGLRADAPKRATLIRFPGSGRVGSHRRLRADIHPKAVVRASKPLLAKGLASMSSCKRLSRRNICKGQEPWRVHDRSCGVHDAARTGQPHRTRVDPRPADPRVAHSDTSPAAAETAMR